MNAPDTVDPEHVRTLRDEILARAEFAHDPSWGERLLEPLLARLLKWMEELSPLARGVLMGVLVVALVGVFLHVLWGLLAANRDAAPARTPLRDARPKTTARAADEWLREALVARARGQHRESVRLAWLGAIAALQRGGALSARADGRARADYEIIDDVLARAGELALPVAELAGHFQRARYGELSVDADATSRCLEHASRIVEWARARA